MNNRIRLLCLAQLTTLLITPALSADVANPPERIIESTSSGLVTFSARHEALRVAVVMAEPDDAVVPTLVKFIDARGNVLKRQRGEVSYGNSMIVELRGAPTGRADALVRVEVWHALPGQRERRYPILVTTQPVDPSGGIGGFVLDWNGGHCGCPTCGPPSSPGQHVNCEPLGETDI